MFVRALLGCIFLMGEPSLAVSPREANQMLKTGAYDALAEKLEEAKAGASGEAYR